MTDKSVTERLREMLDERGAEYFADDDERAYDEPARTTWDFVLCGYEMTVTATEFVDIEGKTYLEMDFHHAFTPAQAIAATLGSEFNPDDLPVGLTISDDSNLLNWRGENYVKQSTLGSGTLRAEQVRKTVEKHWHDLPAEYDMPEATALPEYSYDWQSIADELNATLGGGECELTETESYSNANEVIHVLECSACGETCEHVNGSYPRCPNCGCKAVKR